MYTKIQYSHITMMKWTRVETFNHNFVWIFLILLPFGIMHEFDAIGMNLVENPFEGTANDVPITTMSRGIEIDLREMLDEPSETIPKPIKAIYDTEM